MRPLWRVEAVSGDWADFDRYCDEHEIQPGEEPAAFAAWLHERTGWDGQAAPFDLAEHFPGALRAAAPPVVPMVDCSWLDWHPGHGGTDEFLWGRDHALWRMQHAAYEDCVQTGRPVKPYTKPRPPIGGLIGLALRLLGRPR